VHGPAQTLARMAAVAGVSPAELTEAGRADAAEALASREADAGHEQMLRRVREMSPDQARELLAAIAVQLGIRADADEPRYGT
jgi:hypothetical protein